MSQISVRETWIDQSKGLAIILVVLGHVVTNGISSGVISDIGIWSVINKEIYAFHMPLFFFISGYLAYPKVLQIANWDGVNKQFGKILCLIIPYVVFSAIYLSVKLFLGSSGVVVNPVHTSDLFNIYRLPIGEYWFLYALIIYNIINLIGQFLARLGRREEIYGGLLLIVTILALLIAVGFIDISGFIIKHEGLRRPLLYSVYFFVGTEISKYNLGIDKIANIICIITAIVISLLFLDVLTKQSGIFRLLIAISMVFMIVRLFKWIDISFIGVLGKNSMAIYLLHPFFIVLCKVLLSRYVCETLYVILATAVSVIIPYVLYMCVIKRVSFMNFVFEPKKYLTNESRTKNKLSA